MRLNFKIAMVAFPLLLQNCSSDDGGSPPPSEEWGAIQVKFENRFEGLSPIILNQTTQTSSSGQSHQFSALKYIVSNFTLTNQTGQEYTYHFNDPDKGAFIIDQNDAVVNEIIIDLDSIPAGNYTKVKFGLGISPEAYLLGGESQGELWADANQEGMAWGWATGYVFVVLEGMYGTAIPDTNFLNHTGNMGDVTQNGTPDLYREIELEFPTQMEVSTQAFPAIHIIADLNQYLSGETNLILDSSNHDEEGSSQHLMNVTNNLSKMFSVDHIHNN